MLVETVACDGGVLHMLGALFMLGLWAGSGLPMALRGREGLPFHPDVHLKPAFMLALPVWLYPSHTARGGSGEAALWRWMRERQKRRIPPVADARV
jgi:hypothetical protein